MHVEMVRKSSVDRIAVILERLANDEDDRIVVARNHAAGPFFLQWPQTQPLLPRNTVKTLIDKGLIAASYGPVKQRHGGLDDDAVAYHTNKGGTVYDITDAGLAYLGIKQAA